jgi:hypothetical protein
LYLTFTFEEYFEHHTQTITVVVQPGIIGLNYFSHNGIITAIREDAQNEIKKIIRTGCKITYLDNIPFIEDLFQEKKSGSKPYTLSFVKPVIV